MLFIAGGDDNLMPPAVKESNVKHYRHTKAVTDYKEFADYALEWATEHAAARPAS